jgi:nucleoside phosphorylase
MLNVTETILSIENRGLQVNLRFTGLIASGNQAMKHGQMHDRLVKEHGIICFEMEVARLMN